jgi:hypothetical protein
MIESIYTEKKTLVGVALGGPLAGAYYFWRTFKTLGMPRAALASPIIAGLLLVVIFVAALTPGLDRIPNFVFWGAQFGLTYGGYRGYLAPYVQEHLREGKPQVGWLTTIVIALVSMAATLGTMLTVLYLAGGFGQQTFKTFGSLRHEIAYSESNISPEEVDRLGSALTSSGFFDQEQQKTVDASKDGDRYILNIYCNESVREPEAMEYMRGFRRELQESFPSNPIVLDLVIGTPDNRIARIE